MRKKATWKDKPKAIYKVYKRGVVGKGGDPILLTKDAKKKFLEKYVYRDMILMNGYLTQRLYVGGARLTLANIINHADNVY
jgi:hypothetical protein